jgi:hypothetical protein
MSKILLGKDNQGSEVYFNYEPYQSKSILVQGITGSRKTSLILELIKRFNKTQPRPQIIVISREQEESVLRKEISFILVGEEGEIPIDVKLAQQLGEQTRKQYKDVMVFLTSLKTEKEQDEFLASFIDGLMMDGQQRFWKPLLFVIDEAQLFCNSSKSSRSRDAIVRLIELGRKRGIIGIFSSHQMKDFYVRARAECGNGIIGYLRNPSDREFACDLLNIPKSEADNINGFRDEPKGRFYAEGSDIVIPAKIFLLESTKYSNEEKFTIPKLSFEARQKADALRQSLKLEDNVSIESRLRFELSSLQSQVDTLSETQMTDKNIVKFKEEGFMIGYNKCTDDTYHRIEESRPHGITSLIKHGPTVTIIQEGWKKRLEIK